MSIAITWPTASAPRWPRPSRPFRRWSARTSSAHGARASSPGRCPPQPVLAEYGAGFPDFVADYEPARGLPYLADVARLDWALNVAFHSPMDRRLVGGRPRRDRGRAVAVAERCPVDRRDPDRFALPDRSHLERVAARRLGRTGRPRRGTRRPSGAAPVRRRGFHRPREGRGGLRRRADRGKFPRGRGGAGVGRRCLFRSVPELCAGCLVWRHLLRCSKTKTGRLQKRPNLGLSPERYFVALHGKNPPAAMNDLAA